jgi:hypothetical protein
VPPLGLGRLEKPAAPNPAHPFLSPLVDGPILRTISQFCGMSLLHKLPQELLEIIAITLNIRCCGDVFRCFD